MQAIKTTASSGKAQAPNPTSSMMREGSSPYLTKCGETNSPPERFWKEFKLS